MQCQEFRSAAITSSFATITLLMSAASFADASKTAATPRQLAHCLIQRIHEDRRGDRTESYKDALKACKEDVAAETDRTTTTAMNSGNEAEAAR
jgi:hypothetical protein